jgi:hypothetical protein
MFLRARSPEPACRADAISVGGLGLTLEEGPLLITRITPAKPWAATRGTIALLVAAAALLGAGCDGDEPASTGSHSSHGASPTPEASQTEAPSPEQSPSAPPASACPNESATLADDALIRPGSLHGDVDGDGVADEIRLVVDPKADPKCQAWVTVSSSGGELATAIDEEDLLLDLGMPTLERLVALDNRAGDDVLIRLRAGASTEFFTLYTVVDGTLRRVRIFRDGKGVPAPFTLASGGSVGHLDAADCARDLVVVSSAVLEGDRYRVTRSFFTPGPVLLGESTQRKMVRPNKLAEFPEFASTPLGSCVLP